MRRKGSFRSARPFKLPDHASHPLFHPPRFCQATSKLIQQIKEMGTTQIRLCFGSGFRLNPLRPSTFSLRGEFVPLETQRRLPRDAGHHHELNQPPDC